MLKHEAPSLLNGIARSALERINEFNPQNLSHTAWAYATLKHEAPVLLDGIARSAVERINEFNPQELANTAWAFAVCNMDAKSWTRFSHERCLREIHHYLVLRNFFSFTNSIWGPKKKNLAD
jgi:hypothetical protein